MDTMHIIDIRLHIGLTKMQRALDGLTRSAAIDKYNAAKDQLDAEWQADLDPVMRDLYWHPFRNGINEAPEDEGNLRKWLRERYDDAAVIAILLLLLQRYHRRAANLGGQTALDLLGIDATFRLANDDYLQEIDDRAEMLTTQGSEQSLIDTTIDDLTAALVAARKNEAGALLAMSAYIVARAAQRAVLIERYERPWAVARVQEWTYTNNAVSHVMYDINGVGCAKICAPDHGRVFPLGRWPRGLSIPRHSGCDCIWSPVRYDGQAVGYPPVTVSVPGLAPWQQPSIPWLGGTP